MTENKRNATSSFKKIKNYSLASLTPTFTKPTEQIFPEAVCRNEEHLAGNSQHRLLKSKPHLTKLTAFYDETAGSVNEE